MVFLQVCSWVARMVLRQDLENTVCWAAYDGQLVCARALDQLLCTCFRSLAKDASWRSLHRWKSTLCCWKGKKFYVFSSLNDAFTNSATGEEAIGLVSWGDDLLNKRVSVASLASQTLPTHFMHVKETQCTLLQAKNRLGQTYFEQFHCKQRKKAYCKAPQTTGHTADIQRAARLGRSGVGRIDKRSHFLDRAEPMGGSAQRWTGLWVWEIPFQRSTPRSLCHHLRQ